MATVTRRRSVGAPPQEAWGIVSDPERILAESLTVIAALGSPASPGGSSSRVREALDGLEAAVEA